FQFMYHTREDSLGIAGLPFLEGCSLFGSYRTRCGATGVNTWTSLRYGAMVCHLPSATGRLRSTSLIIQGSTGPNGITSNMATVLIIQGSTGPDGITSSMATVLIIQGSTGPDGITSN